jgi:hypothetical protein
MRLMLPLVASLFAAAVHAQSPLSMPFTANNGLGAGAQVFIDLNVTDPAGITLTNLNVNTGTTTIGTVGTVEVWTKSGTYVGFEQNAAPWSLGASGAVIASGNNLPSPACLGAGLFLPQGVHGVAIRHIGVAVRYTGTGTTVPPVTTSVRNEVTLSAGKGQATPFVSTPFSPRIFNGDIYYNVGAVPGGACPPPAAVELYGTGCYASFGSVYELFADAAAASAALSNQSVVFTPVGSNYLVQWGGASYVAPTTPVNLFATPTDDGEATLTPSAAFPAPAGPQATLRVHSNGVVSWGAAAQTFPGTNNYTPTATGFLDGANAGFYAWHDYAETFAGSGRIVWEEVGSVLYITWDNVYSYGTQPNPSTVQFQMNLSTGVVAIVWTTVSPDTTSTFGSGHLVGYSPAGASPNPGSVSLATALPIVTQADAFPLGLNSNLPKFNTNWNLTTSNAEAISPIAIVFFGDTQVNPGIDLGFIGAPGCAGYTSANLTSLTAPLAGGTGSVTVAIPNDFSLGGTVLTAQSVSFTLQNPLGLNTSNGLKATIGL